VYMISLSVQFSANKLPMAPLPIIATFIRVYS
jgi:hypothetical protein